MHEGRRAGRPRSASREMLEEAAVELFLEQGYADTSVADITRRAGVSRATFFNYIPAKSDLLWTSVDDALAVLGEDLAPSGDGVPGREVGAPPAAGAVGEARAALVRAAELLEPGTVVLAFGNAEPMGVADELEESAARRQRRAAAQLAGFLRRRGVAELEAEVVGAALAGAFLAALRSWSRVPVPRPPLTEVLARALDALSRAGGAAPGEP
ncbi:TetR/AcrR family transcriptional regulator [Oceanitalea stevensii]|uniref:TetR family transcriptional regulator n=1 Tax=Oceanitalea stevensii TaxID=2763072 RepID=A0ABR8Z5N8_9MICO|nr:TetR/AcrR family transcriptional regulator [Oceanitalea stevensii]MBD8063657.1 TetR family transcriptional regulator [Oceanitalea stevensii]